MTTENQPVPKAREPRMDSGWAWVVLVGAFISYFTGIGFFASLGVYINVWMEYFDATVATTGLVISIGSLMRGFMGPVSGALITAFGCRKMTIVGGVITMGGIMMSSQAPSIVFLIFSNGIVTAIGSSMVFSATFQVLGFYFKKRFILASGLSSAGISVGQLALPPLFTLLINKYGWRGSFIIIGGLSAHALVAGALMRPNVVKMKKIKDSVATETKGNDMDNENTSRTEVNKGDEIVSANGEVENGQTDLDEVATCGNDIAINLPDNISYTAEPAAADFPHMANTIFDPFLITIADDGIDRRSLHESVIYKKPNTVFGSLEMYLSRFKFFLLETYGLKRLVRNVSFLIILLVALFHGIGKLGVVYIVARAQTVGIDAELSSLLLSMIGFGSVIGRTTHGWFIDKKYITAEMTYALVMLLFCVTVAMMPVFTTFPPLAILAVLLGIAAGTSASLILVIVRFLVLPTDTAGAVGVLILFWGLGDIIGSLVAGVIYDKTQSYDAAFYTGGAILLSAGILTLVIYFIQKSHRRKHLRDEQFQKYDAEDASNVVQFGFGQLDPDLAGTPSEDVEKDNFVYTSSDEEDPRDGSPKVPAVVKKKYVKGIELGVAREMQTTGVDTKDKEAMTDFELDTGIERESIP